MRYAGWADWALLWAGVLTSLLVGVCPGLNLLVFRGISDVMVRAQAELERQGALGDWVWGSVLQHVLLYALLALLSFGAGYAATAAFYVLAERQLRQYRQHYLARLLHQDLAWLDTHEVGQLTERITA